MRSTEERFFEKVNKTDDCWLWTASTNGDGYGIFWYSGFVLAHRWSWEKVNGPVPEGLTLDHTCRVHACVRPSHLEPVTQRENILRGTSPAAAHARKTHCPQGHEYNEANIYMYRGSRKCRACNAMHQAKRRKEAHA